MVGDHIVGKRIAHIVREKVDVDGISGDVVDKIILHDGTVLMPTAFEVGSEILCDLGETPPMPGSQGWQDSQRKRHELND